MTQNVDFYLTNINFMNFINNKQSRHYMNKCGIKSFSLSFLHNYFFDDEIITIDFISSHSIAFKRGNIFRIILSRKFFFDFMFKFNIYVLVYGITTFLKNNFSPSTYCNYLLFVIQIYLFIKIYKKSQKHHQIFVS